MRRHRLAGFGALCAVLLVGAATGVAPAATPGVTASQAVVAGSPTAIACGGSLDAQVTLTGQSGTTGAATDVMLVLDLSGSTGVPPSKLADLRRAATDTLDALDAADGAADHSIASNRAGIVIYQGSSAAIAAPVGSSYDTLVGVINGSLVPAGGSPHAAGITTASGGLAGGANAKAMVLMSDGQAAGADLTNASNAATTAKGSGIRILAVGLGTGTDVSQANLSSWASDSSFYQSGTPGPISTTKLIGDLGALVSTPASFAVTETLGANFSAAPVSASTGTTTGSGTGTLGWTGALASGQTATLVYRATRNGNEVFSTTTELVSTMTLAVGGGGTATVTPPASISIDVLPCGATPIAATTCTGTACSVSGSQGGTQYTVNAGTPPAGTSVVLSGLNTPAPPAGTCAGFHSHTTGAEFDIRPLTRDATFRMVIPKGALGSLKWFQTDVCLGTNLKFITAIQSLSNLSPQAMLVGGGALPGRYWGLLPSIPRVDWIPGRGFVLGPWITSRSQDSAGNAVITFVVPFVSASTGVTTDGKAAYDPKIWG